MKFFALAFALLLPLSVVAAPSAAPLPTKFRIFGNQIYDDETVLKVAGIDYEVPLSELEMKQKLETTGYFSLVRVRKEGDTVTIVLREKTPWFALPYFSSESGRTVYGVAGGLVGLGGASSAILGRYQTGSENKIVSLMYRDDFFLDSFWIFGLTFNYEHGLSDVLRERQIVRRMEGKTTSQTLHLGYHLSPDLLVELDTHVEVHRFEQEDYTRSRGTHVSHRLFAEYGLFYVNEGLSKGFKLKPYIEVTNPALSDYHFYQVGVFGQKSVYLNGDFNWITRPRVEYGKPQPFYQKFELGAGKLRGFPSQTFRAESYAAVQNDVLLTSLDFWKVKLRPMVYADWAYVDSGGRTGLGAGLQVYFRSVAVPAIQIYGGYGFRPNGFSLSAAIGPQI